MTRVLIGDTVIAESDKTVMVEGNPYFPPDAIKKEFYEMTDLHTICPWKGEASYYTITVGDEVKENAAWTYLQPTTERAEPLKDYVAFYANMVTIER